MITRRTPEQRASVVTQIESWIRSHPGATFTEISLAIDVHTDDVRKLTPRRVRHLITDLESEAKNRGGYQTTWTNERILQSLRDATAFESVLTGARYGELVADGTVKGPTLARVIQVFGSWAAACSLAGVEAGTAPRENYSRSWTESELVEYMGQFLLENDSASLEAYAKWSTSDPQIKRPSAGTIRNQVGQWSDVKARALRELRRRWT